MEGMAISTHAFEENREGKGDEYRGEKLRPEVSDAEVLQEHAGEQSGEEDGNYLGEDEIVNLFERRMDL